MRPTALYGRQPSAKHAMNSVRPDELRIRDDCPAIVLAWVVDSEETH